MIGNFGKAKTGAGKPLAQRTTKQLTNVVTKLSAGTNLSARQTKKLDRATSILEKRHPTQEQAPPPNGAKPVMPTTAPPAGYAWVYDPVGNQYVEQQIPVTQSPPAGSYYSGGGGGGGGAPDFSPYAYDPSTGGGPGFGPATDTAAPVSALQSAMSAPASMSTGVKAALGVAAAVGVVYFLKKRRGARGA